MKKILFIISAGFVILLSGLTATAQEDVRPVPSWVSDRGYWVVENHKDSSIVYFYNNDNLLVYRRELGESLNPARRKTKLLLTRELEKAISRQNTSVYRQMTNGAKNADVGQ